MMCEQRTAVSNSCEDKTCPECGNNFVIRRTNAAAIPHVVPLNMPVTLLNNRWRVRALREM